MPQPATCISIGSTKLRRRSSELRTGRYRGPIPPPGIFTSRSSEGTTQPWNGSSRGPKVTTSEPELTHFKALALARSGQLERAGSLARRAVDLSEKARQRERAAVFQTAPAVWHALMGNVAEARRTAALALDMSTGRDVSYAAAFALALTGELSRSQALLKDLEARFPQDTTVNISYLPALRGLIALQQGKPAEALQKLEPALSNEFALPGTAFFASFGSLYPAYVRGQTYLAAKRPADAAVEFRKIISRRGLVMEDPIDAVARLQLARALAASGDTARARAATRTSSPCGSRPTRTFRS